MQKKQTKKTLSLLRPNWPPGQQVRSCRPLPSACLRKDSRGTESKCGAPFEGVDELNLERREEVLLFAERDQLANSCHLVAVSPANQLEAAHLVLRKNAGTLSSASLFPGQTGCGGGGCKLVQLPLHVVPQSHLTVII